LTQFECEINNSYQYDVFLAKYNIRSLKSMYFHSNKFAYFQF